MSDHRDVIQRLRSDWQRLQEQQASLTEAYLLVLSVRQPSRQQLQDIQELMDAVSDEMAGLRTVIARLLADDEGA